MYEDSSLYDYYLSAMCFIFVSGGLNQCWISPYGPLKYSVP